MLKLHDVEVTGPGQTVVLMHNDYSTCTFSSRDCTEGVQKL